MKTIAIDCRMIDCSGIGSFLKGILPELVCHNDSNWLLIGKIDKLQKYESVNVKIITCDIPIFSLRELLFFPVKEINKCDAFFSPNYNIPIGIKVPVFSTIHDVLFLDFPNLAGKIGSLIRKLAVWRVLYISCHIFTVSNFSKSRILSHFNLDKSITVCYNGADNVLDVIIGKPNIYVDGEYYIFVGNIKPHKGLNTLLDAFEQSEVKELGRKLVIVGNQEAFKTSDATVYKRISELSGSNKIIFTGHIDNVSLIELIKNAYCLVQPSEYEGFGLPPLEALQLGTPVIISDIPVFQELYHDFPVIFFKPSDASSLASAMMLPLQRVMLDDTLKNKYTYKRTADIILSDIKSYLQ